MIDWALIQKLMNCFPKSFINQHGEFIAHDKANAYFILHNCETELANLEAHSVVRSTGELWTNEYLSIGVPRGYVVVDVDGEDISWKFKPTVYQSGKSWSTTPAYSHRNWNR